MDEAEEYKIFPRVTKEDTKGYSNVHLLFANQWWDGLRLYHPSQYRTCYFKAIMYALSHFDKENIRHPNGTDVRTWIMENHEALADKIMLKYRMDESTFLDEKQLTKHHTRIIKVLKVGNGHTTSDIVNIMRWTGIINIRIRKAQTGIVHGYSFTDTGKKINNYIKMNYLL